MGVVNRGLMLDRRRMFSRPEVRRAWERQNRLCHLCGRAIPFDLMHGDHIVPWSGGGPTTMKNLQVLCGSCNLRKGARPQEIIEQDFELHRLQPGVGELRRWQADAIQIVLQTILHGPVLIEACPGAGKTHFGLEVAYRLVAEGHISRVLIVVPTIGIADGWQTSASRGSSRSPSLPLHGLRDWRPVNPIGDAWLGAITTYQSLFASTDMFLAHATDPGHRTLVIFDEVHHAGAAAAWGQSAQEAFATNATALLSLTGTPFRTDRDPIVFVPSEGGSARPHYRYSYDQAIQDRSCRPVQFVETRGETNFRTEDGRVHTVSFDDHTLTDIGQRRRLRSALEWVGPASVADKMLRDANSYLIALRKGGDEDAGGLVVCVNCDHAAAVAAYMSTSIVGHRPVVACSRLHDLNDPQPANAIGRFGSSHEPWLVAVNMVSEGIDIPRLRVVVYLTNRMTLLAFRQIVGRVVRTDLSNTDDHGRVYLPGDARLLEMAKQVTDEVDLLPPPLVIVTDPQPLQQIRVKGDELERVAFETLGTIGSQGAIFDTSGRAADSELIGCARLFIKQERLTGTDPESLAMVANESVTLREELLKLRDEL
jgi:superfamily II DNA or RNA helicase